MPARCPLRIATRATALCLLLSGLAACQRAEVRHWPTGAPRSEGRRARLSGLEEGLWTYYYPNGQRREEGRYEAGRRVGRWREWHSNGAPRAEGERHWLASSGASPRDGLWVLWYEEGSTEGRGVYRAGLREGHWDYFRHDGSLDHERTGEYHDDQLLE